MSKAQRRLSFIPYFRKHKSLTSIPENLEVDNFNFDTMSLPHPNLSAATSGASSIPLSLSGQMTDLYNSLKIPDVIKNLPKFEGNPNSLYEFINNVEEILQLIRGTDGTPQGQVLLRAIRNKVEGTANEALNTYGTSLNWDEIKNNLILHFSDKRSETSLIRDLHDLRQNNNSVEEFYDEVMSILSSLSNNLPLQENDNRVIATKKDLFREMCLSAFLAGLREPLGANIRAMRPNTLASALAFCMEEQNIQYQKAGDRQFFKKTNYKNQHNNNTFQPYAKQFRQQNFNRNYPTYNNQQGTNYNNTPYNNNLQFNNKPHYNNKPYNNNNNIKPYFYNNLNTYNRPNFNTKPNTNNNFQNNYNPRSSTTYGNPFNQSQNKNTYAQPEPMDVDRSGITRYTNRTNQTRQSDQSMRTNQSMRSNRFQSQDINNIDNNFEDQHQNEEELCNIEDQPNFQFFASKNPQGT